MSGPITAVAGFVAGFVAEIGDTDCEELHDGDVLVQPINALTSFAYVVVGAVVAGMGWRDPRSRWRSLLFGALLVGVGLGSVAFHGPQPAGSRPMHDLPILLTALFMLAHNLGLLVARIPSWTYWVGTAVLAALAVALPDAGVVATGVVLGAVAVTEVLVYRRRLRPRSERSQRFAYLAIVVILAGGAASWILGKTDSPACDPDGVFQFHGLWHVLSALAFGAWWYLAVMPQRAPDTVHLDEQPV